MSRGIRDGRVLPPLVFITHPRSNPKIPVGMVGIDIGFIPRVRRRHVQKNGLPKRVEIGDGDVGPLVVRAEEIVKFRRVVGSDWLEYIYNV